MSLPPITFQSPAQYEFLNREALALAFLVMGVLLVASELLKWTEIQASTKKARAFPCPLMSCETLHVRNSGIRRAVSQAC